MKLLKRNWLARVPSRESLISFLSKLRPYLRCQQKQHIIFYIYIGCYNGCRYPFNNSLHHHVESIIVSCLESKNVTVINHLFQDCNLIGKVLQADKHSILSSEMILVINILYMGFSFGNYLYQSLFSHGVYLFVLPLYLNLLQSLERLKFILLTSANGTCCGKTVTSNW